MLVYYEDENYRVRQLDEMNIVHEKRAVVKEGKNKGNVTYKADGYYPNLGSALKRLFDRKIANGEAGDNAKSLLKCYKEIVQLLESK